MADPYAILGVTKSASADEIRRAYRKLAKELHPDARPGDAAAEDRFKQVSQAFKLLSDATKKARYDRGEIDADGNERAPFAAHAGPGGAHGHRGRRGPAGFDDVGDIFSDLFTDFSRRERPARGRDIRYRMPLDFLEAAKGVSKRIKLPNGKSVDVKAPPGATNGQVLKLARMGEAGQSGGPAGDVLIELTVNPHKHFSREGEHIRLELPISLKEAVLGAKVRAPTIDGPVDIKIPAGSTTGALLRLRGKGMPVKKGGRGDQIIRLLVDIPANDAALQAFARDWTPPAGYTPRKTMEE
tara:strand:- start:426 stop:1319 length:894 start_codon:yes stop_codon:yes gene_type:complete